MIVRTATVLLWITRPWRRLRFNSEFYPELRRLGNSHRDACRELNRLWVARQRGAF